MAVKVWRAAEAVVKIDAASSVTITGSALLDTFFGSATAFQTQAKGLEITMSVEDADIINLLGEDANNFQNAELEPKPAGLTEISGTLILPGDEVSELEFLGAGSAVTGGTRYFTGKTNLPTVAILLNLDDSTDEVNFAFDNCKLTEWNPSFTGADGHMEISFTAKCLPRDAHGPEFKT